MKSKNQTIVFLDTETTGLDINLNRIIQIGMIKTDQGEIIDTYEHKFNPEGVKSSPEALEKHGITDEELLLEPTFKERVDEILEFLKDSDLGGHNIVGYDLPLLMKEVERCGRKFSIEGRRIYDTYLMYNNYNKRTLDKMYEKYCGEIPEAIHLHSALSDTILSLDLYKAICKEHEPTVEELDEMNGNNTRVDVEGFFVLDENMKVRMGKGKYKGKLVEEVDWSYFDWMSKQDFLSETKQLALRCKNYVKQLM